MEQKSVLMLKAVYNTLYGIRNRLMKNTPRNMDAAQEEGWNALLQYMNKAVTTVFNMLPLAEKEKINASK